ncbi:MAG: hypothetical protein IKI57_04290 [Clostridia bacterium]|nr:hypothetical protein [Clostridia bacterium]
MKKLRYLDEDSVFVYRYLLYGMIALLIVALIANPKAFLEKSIRDIIAEVIALIIMIGLMGTVFFLIVYLVVGKKIKKYKEIRKKGTKVTGKIIAWGVDPGSIDLPDTYCVYVSYTDLAGNQKEFKTPTLNFNPKRRLGSMDCSVYLFEDDVYVTDFIKATNDSMRVFKDTEPIIENKLNK